MQCQEISAHCENDDNTTVNICTQHMINLYYSKETA